jgi:hypothetical protein
MELVLLLLLVVSVRVDKIQLHKHVVRLPVRQHFQKRAPEQSRGANAAMRPRPIQNGWLDCLNPPLRVLTADERNMHMPFT